MAYRLKTGQPVDREVRRIIDRQLRLAIRGLSTATDRTSDDAIHKDRRRLKKIRALIRLVQPALGRFYRPTSRQLRTVSWMLSPIADSLAAVDTLARVGKRFRQELPRATLAAIRVALVQRDTAADRRAHTDHIRRRAIQILRSERRRVRRWRLKTSGSRAIMPGLAKSGRRARQALALAIDSPTIDHYHLWRRRVKDQWLQIRLIETRCGKALAADERQLEALDGCLGEYHNCVLLQSLFVANSFVPRQETAQCLRVLRRYQIELREQALMLGRTIYREPRRAFVRRVREHWRLAKRRDARRHTRTSWAHAA